MHFFFLVEVKGRYDVVVKTFCLPCMYVYCGGSDGGTEETPENTL